MADVRNFAVIGVQNFFSLIESEPTRINSWVLVPFQVNGLLGEVTVTKSPIEFLTQIQRLPISLGTLGTTDRLPWVGILKAIELSAPGGILIVFYNGKVKNSPDFVTSILATAMEKRLRLFFLVNGGNSNGYQFQEVTAPTKGQFFPLNNSKIAYNNVKFLLEIQN